MGGSLHPSPSAPPTPLERCPGNTHAAMAYRRHFQRRKERKGLALGYVRSLHQPGTNHHRLEHHWKEDAKNLWGRLPAENLAYPLFSIIPVSVKRRCDARRNRPPEKGKEGEMKRRKAWCLWNAAPAGDEAKVKPAEVVIRRRKGGGET